VSEGHSVISQSQGRVRRLVLAFVPYLRRGRSKPAACSGVNHRRSARIPESSGRGRRLHQDVLRKIGRWPVAGVPKRFISGEKVLRNAGFVSIGNLGVAISFWKIQHGPHRRLMRKRFMDISTRFVRSLQKSATLGSMSKDSDPNVGPASSSVRGTAT